MGTTFKKMIENDTITSVGIESDLNYFYIMRPNEVTAAEKESKITLEEIYRLLDSDNAYYNSGWFYKAIGTASLYEKSSGVHAFSSAVSGAADASITFVETMRTGLSSNSEKVLSVGKETFEAWDSGAVLQLGGNGFLFNDETNIIWGYNAYYDGAWKYTDADEASRLYQKNDGSLVFEGAVSGTADDPITWVDAFSVSKEGDTVVNGTFNMLSHETISANATITLQKTDKLRTIVVDGTLTQLTVNAGTGVDESSVLRVINETGVDVTITDGIVPYTLLESEETNFYFRGSTFTQKNFGTVKVTSNSTITPQAGTRFLYLVSTTPVDTITFDFSNVATIQIRLLNAATNELTVIDSVASNSFKVPAGNMALFAGSSGSGKITKVSPSIGYNSGKTDPREESRGKIHSTVVTQKTIFDALDPYIPDIGDWIKLDGGIYPSTVFRVVSFATRVSSSVIELSHIRENGTIGEYIITNGVTSTLSAVSFSW